MKIRLSLFLCLLFAAVLALSACDALESPPGALPPGAVDTGGEQRVPAAAPSSSAGFTRTPPEVKMPQFGGANQYSNASGEKSAVLDVSYINDGYVGVQLTGGGRAKFRMTLDSTGEESTYELDSDGTVNFFPVNRGSGSYSFIVYTFAYTDADGVPRYDQFLTGRQEAALTDEFAPYLVPTKLVRYSPESDCVQGSYPITGQCASNAEVAAAIYGWIADNVNYDDAKAEAIGGKPGSYEPMPDDTYNTKLGICFDYASLAAAMLRANGVPAKLIKGEVSLPEGGTIAHAWNMVWLEEEGWIAMDVPIAPAQWNRIDTTFAAGGAGSYVGDGENYTPLSEH